MMPHTDNDPSPAEMVRDIKSRDFKTSDEFVKIIQDLGDVGTDGAADAVLDMICKERGYLFEPEAALARAIFNDACVVAVLEAFRNLDGCEDRVATIVRYEAESHANISEDLRPCLPAKTHEDLGIQILLEKDHKEAVVNALYDIGAHYPAQAVVALGKVDAQNSVPVIVALSKVDFSKGIQTVTLRGLEAIHSLNEKIKNGGFSQVGDLGEAVDTLCLAMLKPDELPKALYALKREPVSGISVFRLSSVFRDIDKMRASQHQYAPAFNTAVTMYNHMMGYELRMQALVPG